MTDAVLADVARIETITALDLGGSKDLTDEGMRHLSRLPALKHLDVERDGDYSIAVFRSSAACRRWKRCRWPGRTLPTEASRTRPLP